MRTTRALGVPMVEALPKCSEHNLAIELVRVEVSEDEVVTDVFRCPYPECTTEHYRQQARAGAPQGRAWKVAGDRWPAPHF
jgi:hypothetical protein